MADAQDDAVFDDIPPPPVVFDETDAPPPLTKELTPAQQRARALQVTRRQVHAVQYLAQTGAELKPAKRATLRSRLAQRIKNKTMKNQYNTFLSEHPGGVVGDPSRPIESLNGRLVGATAKRMAALRAQHYTPLTREEVEGNLINATKPLFANSKGIIAGGPTRWAAIVGGFAQIPSEANHRPLARCLSTYEHPFNGRQKILYRVATWRKV
jgi:hypothetical protein